MMYAPDKRSAIDISFRLMEDGLIGDQKIYVRKYEPLQTYFEGLNGIPITKEFRFFVAYSQVISSGYYWQNYVDDLPEIPDPSLVPQRFLDEVIRRVGDKSNFYVIDVGIKEDGNPIVIELNDGQQSGLSCNDPDLLYKRLKEVIDAQNQ